MPVLRDYECEKCSHKFEYKPDFYEVVRCPKCHELAKRLPVGTKSYRIMGDNSASETPKRFRENQGRKCEKKNNCYGK